MRSKAYRRNWSNSSYWS